MVCSLSSDTSFLLSTIFLSSSRYLKICKLTFQQMRFRHMPSGYLLYPEYVLLSRPGVAHRQSSLTESSPHLADSALRRHQTLKPITRHWHEQCTDTAFLLSFPPRTAVFFIHYKNSST